MAETRKATSKGIALALLLSMLSLPACRSEQSVIHPASQDAHEVARLFWVMTAGGAAIWALVFGIAVYAVVGKRRPKTEIFADRFILIGGVIFPTVVLAALLVFGLRLLPDWRDTESADLHVLVTGEQFWWRVRYDDGTAAFETANRIVLPQGVLVELSLTAEDVIHSFWIPSLGGKLDMIPGRTNLIRLRPNKLGTYRGVCAEFCGLSHALMAFEAEIVAPEVFEAWRSAEAADAVLGAPTELLTGSGQHPDASGVRLIGGETEELPKLAEGLDTFRRAGCAACHQVRGLVEEGSVGPDLTHLAARQFLGAGTLPLDAANLRRWLIQPQIVKPGARMPSYADLPPEELEKIVTFLMGLR